MGQRSALIPEAVLAEIRARLDIAAIVGRQVRLKRVGMRASGLCPFHGEKTPSFEVRTDRRTFHCYGCGAHGDVFSYVMRAEGCSFSEAVARCAAEAGVDVDAKPGERRAAPPPPPAPPPVDHGRKIEAARARWARSSPILPGSPQASYLASRGLWPLPEAAHRVLRAADEEHKATGRALHPVMIARADLPDGSLCAVHCTFLAPRGEGWGKLAVGEEPSKLVFGALPAGAAIRLLAEAPEMGVAEGIETALSAFLLTGVPCWAAISADGMERFVPPPCARRVVAFADRDKPRTTTQVWLPEGRGMAAARVLASALIPRGIAVRIRLPLSPAEDYADVWAARVASAA